MGKHMQIQNSTIYEKIFKDWTTPLDEAGCLVILDELLPKLDILYENRIVYPRREQVFRAFNELPFNDVKVVLLGQDPYHSVHNNVPDACGLSFITENGYVPPSLANIHKELMDDLDAFKAKPDGHKMYDAHKFGVQNYPFTRWVNEGVLMLNTALTVEAGQPGSHIKLWEEFTSKVIKYLAENRNDIVWLILGAKAYSCIEEYKGTIKAVIAAHPSPLARGAFFGSKVFSKINRILEDRAIEW
jgi:uracil-DNA glycosylase